MVPRLEEIHTVKKTETLCGNGVTAWDISTKTNIVQSLHSLTKADWVTPSIWIMSPTDSCLVLGSSQDDSSINYAFAEQKNIGIARRTSGGGAVFVDPQTFLWVDLLIPRGHSLWEDDIGIASNWLGEIWKTALDSLGVKSQMHRSSFQKTAIAELVCFAGRAPGELLIENKKILGISQRRTREGARFQCALALKWEPENWINLFVPESLNSLESAISNTGTCVRVGKKEILRAFLSVLNSY